MHKLLFPELEDSWKYLNLGELAKEVVSDNNPLLNPENCAIWVEEVHVKNNTKYSYGGYLEDRSILWKGHYHKPGHAIHLGIDYNVPAGTLVHMPCDGLLIYSNLDEDQNGGWGGKLIFDTEDKNCPFLILGHLSDIPTIGKIFKKGDVVGKIANYPYNGNWFPHLHVQTASCFKINGVDVTSVDGYSNLYEGIEKDFPNPELLYKIQKDAIIDSSANSDALSVENSSLASKEIGHE